MKLRGLPIGDRLQCENYHIDRVDVHTDLPPFYTAYYSPDNRAVYMGASLSDAEEFLLRDDWHRVHSLPKPQGAWRTLRLGASDNILWDIPIAAIKLQSPYYTHQPSPRTGRYTSAIIIPGTVSEYAEGDHVYRNQTPKITFRRFTAGGLYILIDPRYHKGAFTKYALEASIVQIMGFKRITLSEMHFARLLKCGYQTRGELRETWARQAWRPDRIIWYVQVAPVYTQATSGDIYRAVRRKPAAPIQGWRSLWPGQYLAPPIRKLKRRIKGIISHETQTKPNAPGLGGFQQSATAQLHF
jgi:hypothetical protein